MPNNQSTNLGSGGRRIIIGFVLSILYVNYLLKRLQIVRKRSLSLKSPKYNIEHILWGVRLEKRQYLSNICERHLLFRSLPARKCCL